MPRKLCNGVLADSWRKEERGKGQAIYGMLTWVAPCVAPICGAYIDQGVSWRWIFFSTSIFTVFVQIAALLFLDETFAPVILAKKAKIIRKALQGIRPDVVVRTDYETNDRFSKILRKRLILPFIMMFTHPATQVPSIYRAYLYGVMYLMLSTFPMVFEQVYNMSIGIASLNYLSLCLGFMIGLKITHPLMDGVSPSPLPSFLLSNASTKQTTALRPPQNTLQRRRRNSRIPRSPNAHRRTSVSDRSLHLRLEHTLQSTLDCA